MIQLYKGKGTRWYIGTLDTRISYNGKLAILFEHDASVAFSVREDTICRYTEIDYKEQRVFENDVIREWIEDSQEPEGGSWSYSVIKMHQGSWCVCGINYEYKDPERLWDRLSGNFEIYGSIFDHPELLKDDTQPSN